VRTWGFWTEHKLDLLGDYLHAFTTASSVKAHGTTVYLDLFAGQVVNTSRTTGLPIAGSPVRALQTTPVVSTVVLFEMPARAATLRAKLTADFPGRDIRIHSGDCNDNIDEALADLAPVRWAPTFAFIDQQSSEIRWETLAKLAAHKRDKKYKVEVWLLFAHAQLPRGLGVKRETDERFARGIDLMLGTTQWRAAYDARRTNELDGEQFRDALTNWMRWRLERDLGYSNTHAFELRNDGGSPVYSMIFATDNPTGNKIMSQLYGKAAREHGAMREQALALTKGRMEDEGSTPGLFPPIARVSTIDPEKLYKPSPPTEPFGWSSDQTNAS
jgi:three-Cys-motif partner protein